MSYEDYFNSLASGEVALSEAEYNAALSPKKRGKDRLPMQKMKIDFVVAARSKAVHVADKYGRTVCRPNEATGYIDPHVIGMTDPQTIPQIARICSKCFAIMRYQGVNLNDYRAKK
ncbi:hypothetical protein [Providencia sp. CRPN22473]